MIRILFGIPYDLPKINAEAALSNLVISGKIEQAKDFHEEHKENKLYNFSEEAFNKFGYSCLKSSNIQAAIEIFKWNVEMHPKSSNVYDSLGEAYLKNGDTSKALEFYTISYSMDPKNKNAKEKINELKKNR